MFTPDYNLRKDSEASVIKYNIYFASSMGSMKEILFSGADFIVPKLIDSIGDNILIF